MDDLTPIDVNPEGSVPPAPPAGRHRRWIGLAAAGGLVAGLAIGATALAGASSQVAGAPTQTPPAPDANTPQPPAPGPRRGMRGPAKLGPGIHGEFVVPGPNGGYQTLASQNGTVSSVSSTSITVKSEDGFERTYVVDENTVVDAGRDGIADVKQGETVRLMAVVTGDTAKAVQINDQTALRQHRGTWRPGRPGAGPNTRGPDGGPNGGPNGGASNGTKGANGGTTG